MEQWQGISWQRGKWRKKQWYELQELLNSGQEFQLLIINPVSPTHCYTRAVIQYASCGDEFSIALRWEAGFSKRKKAWTWIAAPDDYERPVNTWGFSFFKKDWSDCYPYVEKTSHGDLLKLTTYQDDDTGTSTSQEAYCCMDPLVNVTCSNGHYGFTDSGLFIVPPDYGVRLFVNQIHSKVRIRE